MHVVCVVSYWNQPRSLKTKEPRRGGGLHLGLGLPLDLSETPASRWRPLSNLKSGAYATKLNKIRK